MAACHFLTQRQSGTQGWQLPQFVSDASGVSEV